ncbi:MAG: DUF1330 domain-containing protein [Proteobacteria bacterium]|jgi:uncharacterized protein (DUF1330 family)|nr:hypothetical protein [Methylibium sp.]MBY0367206.1 DUF1330 domain-containing protein [Burkholderiaceae bacterium]MCH8855212.1 DUF1330 domain-containing protein [Pseudomonadota bacterium]|mmetsp:Transcript_15314/g.36493  ORF Transcript_15314/g.36493 Transcript_15314/m.36493 type:complete len:122 (+) Transcript_15314:2862-3227(+)
MPRIWKPLLGVLTAAAVGSAMAQVKPGIAVVEIDVRQPEAFAKEFFPLAAKVFADAGGVFLVKPSAPRAVDEVPPKRVAIIRFESVEKAVATFASPAYREARQVGDQYASFRIFVLESTEP